MTIQPTSNQTFTNATNVAINNLAFPVVAGEKYEFKAFLNVHGSATQVGIGVTAAVTGNGNVLQSLISLPHGGPDNSNLTATRTNGLEFQTKTLYPGANQVVFVEGVILAQSNGTFTLQLSTGPTPIGGSSIVLDAAKSILIYNQI